MLPSITQPHTPPPHLVLGGDQIMRLFFAVVGRTLVRTVCCIPNGPIIVAEKGGGHDQLAANCRVGTSCVRSGIVSSAASAKCY